MTLREAKEKAVLKHGYKDFMDFCDRCTSYRTLEEVCDEAAELYKEYHEKKAFDRGAIAQWELMKTTVSLKTGLNKHTSNGK